MMGAVQAPQLSAADELLDSCISAVDSSSDEDSNEVMPLVQMAGRQQEWLEFHAATLEHLADLEQTDQLHSMDAQLLPPAAPAAPGCCHRLPLLPPAAATGRRARKGLAGRPTVERCCPSCPPETSGCSG